MYKNYSYTYPKNFFLLFGSLSDESLEIPENLPINDEHDSLISQNFNDIDLCCAVRRLLQFHDFVHE